MIDTLKEALDRGPLIVTVRTGKRETRITGCDPFVIEIAARPIGGAANRELLRFLKENIGACRITSGAGSRTKRIERQ
jgi:uncharacterized protein YggU (UPF0235/DUF167 family)